MKLTTEQHVKRIENMARGTEPATARKLRSSYRAIKEAGAWIPQSYLMRNFPEFFPFDSPFQSDWVEPGPGEMPPPQRELLLS